MADPDPEPPSLARPSYWRDRERATRELTLVTCADEDSWHAAFPLPGGVAGAAPVATPNAQPAATPLQNQVGARIHAVMHCLPSPLLHLATLRRCSRTYRWSC